MTDWLAFAVWEDGELIRSLNLSPGSGIMENTGEPYGFELHYRAGEHPAVMSAMSAIGGMFLTELPCLTEEKESKTTTDLPPSTDFPSLQSHRLRRSLRSQKSHGELGLTEARSGSGAYWSASDRLRTHMGLASRHQPCNASLIRMRSNRARTGGRLARKRHNACSDALCGATWT
jgi:hypothetical protein